MRFLGDFNYWELNFFHMLESNTATVSGDCVWWKLKKNGGFDIHSYYASFLSCLDGGVREDIGDNLRRRGF